MRASPRGAINAKCENNSAKRIRVFLACNFGMRFAQECAGNRRKTGWLTVRKQFLWSSLSSRGDRVTARCERTRYDLGKRQTAISSSTRENGNFLIEVDRLSVSYYCDCTKDIEKRNWITGSLNHSVQALDGSSLALQAGKTTCLVGESGSGKSTLARCTALLGQR